MMTSHRNHAPPGTLLGTRQYGIADTTVAAGAQLGRAPTTTVVIT